MLRDPKVRFAGYRIPHPLEKDIEVLVQVKDGSTDSPLAALDRTVTHLEMELRRLQAKYRDSVRELQRRREQEFDEEGRY